MLEQRAGGGSQTFQMVFLAVNGMVIAERTLGLTVHGIKAASIALTMVTDQRLLFLAFCERNMNQYPRIIRQICYSLFVLH